MEVTMEVLRKIFVTLQSSCRCIHYLWPQKFDAFLNPNPKTLDLFLSLNFPLILNLGIQAKLQPKIFIHNPNPQNVLLALTIPFNLGYSLEHSSSI